MSKVQQEQETIVELDYPRKGETITSSEYTIRVSAPQAQSVEVSIDRTAGRLCRAEAGFFWFDWSGYMNGQHEISAIARLEDGSIEETKVRRVRVERP